MIGTFTARDGENLALYEWPLDAWTDDTAQGGLAPCAMVLLLHGLGEHAGRYDHVARQLNDWGFAVRGYDQCGHGESGGARGSLPTDTRMLDDLADLVDSTRARMRKGLPLILLGHSMGGLVVGRFVSLKMREVDGLVMSSPALNAGMNAFQKLLVSILPKIAPDLRVGNGVKPQFISHDPSVVSAYKADPLVHDRISAQLARFIADAGPQTVALAAQWTVPTLLLYAGDDRLLNPQGSRDFAENAANSSAVKRGTVTARCFEDMYHELFNESRPAPVFEALKAWLDAKF